MSRKSLARKGIIDLDDARADRESKRLAQYENRHEWLKALIAAPLSVAAIKVGVALVEHWISAQHGTAWPSHETIAKACGLTPRGARAGAKALEAAGFILVRKTKFSGSNEYRLALPGLSQSVTAMTECSANPSPPCRSIRHGHAAQSVMAMPLNPSWL